MTCGRKVRTPTGVSLIFPAVMPRYSARLPKHTTGEDCPFGFRSGECLLGRIDLQAGVQKRSPFLWSGDGEQNFRIFRVVLNRSGSKIEGEAMLGSEQQISLTDVKYDIT